MKNILIPTSLDRDTLHAVKVALTDAKPSVITLLLFSDPDASASAAYWLRQSRNGLTAEQERLLDECAALADRAQSALKIRHQYAITGPLLRGLFDYLDVELVIVPESFRLSNKSIHRQCVKLLRNARLPILQLSSSCDRPGFSNALYVQQSGSVGRLGELLHTVDAFFNLRIVSQLDASRDEEWTPRVFETIHQKEIDLVVETRTANLRTRGKRSIGQKLELPVLSLYEPIS